MIKAIKNGLKKIPLPKYVLQWGVYEATVFVTFSVMSTMVGVSFETAYLLFILTNTANVVYYEVAMIASQPAIIILLHKCLRRMHANLTRMVIYLQCDRCLVFHGESHFEMTYVHFVDVCSEKVIREQILKEKSDTRLALVNRGDITITERFTIIDKTAMTMVHAQKEQKVVKDELIEGSEKTLMKTPLNFALENRGNLNVIHNIYLVVNDTDEFIRSGFMGLLAEGVTWDSPVDVKENSGTIQRWVEIAVKMGEKDAHHFDEQCALANKPMTKLDCAMMRKYNLDPMDMKCFKAALCSIRP